MQIITFDGYDSEEAVNEPLGSRYVECEFTALNNVIAFDKERQRKATLEAFKEILNTEITFD